ncbi:MAG: hypothetical protein OHK0022_29860 [Roseiflexaceae bacterium]
MADEEKTREPHTDEGQLVRITNLGPLVNGVPPLVGPMLDGVAPSRLFNRAAPTTPDRFQLLIDHAPIGIVISRAFAPVYVNPAYLRMFGLGNLAELEALSPLDLVAPESQALVAGRMELRTRGLLPSASFEAIGLRRDGTHFPFFAEIAEIEWEGQPATAAFVFDISAQKRSLEQQRRAEERLELLSTVSALLVALLDNPVVLLQVARCLVPALADICLIDLREGDKGLRRAASATAPALEEHANALLKAIDPPLQPLLAASLDAQTVLALPDPLACPGHTAALAQLRLHGPGALLIIPLVARERVVGALALLSPEDTPPDRALAEEVARRLALAVDGALIYQELQNSLRLREQFLATAAHELRTPLTALLGHAQLLRRRITRTGNVDDRDLRALHVMVDQAARLNNIVAALLDLTRLDGGQLRLEPQPLDMVALVRDALDVVIPATRSHTLHLELPDGPLMIEGDATRLTQMVQHLAGNAIKYSPGGGEIRVRLEHEDALALLTVTDQGIGIPESALPLLFRRFYRAPNAQQISGLGIGLHLIHQIVSMHGGTISVASSEGAGSTFTVQLPATGA